MICPAPEGKKCEYCNKPAAEYVNFCRSYTVGCWRYWKPFKYGFVCQDHQHKGPPFDINTRERV